MQKLIVVYNPRSSQYVHVRKDVLDKLPGLSGFMVGKYAVQKTNFNDNVKNLSTLLKDGDLVIAAGGDATAAIAFNAILNSRKKVALSVLPCGNFNDFARTLKTKNLEEALSGFKEQKIKKMYPLDIVIDGQHFRYASNYVTIGMTAAAVEIFDDPAIRKELQKGRKTSWRSYFNLMKWYFQFRRKRNYLPEFKLNGKKAPKQVSDYAAVSGRSMAKVMKGGDDYLKPKVFRSELSPTVKFFPLVKLMLQSIFVRTPGDETKGDTLDFVKPSTVTLQAEGEYQAFEKISQIKIEKTEKSIEVVDLN